jgi:putative endonuclease
MTDAEAAPYGCEMKREYAYFVYVLASARNGTLYVGLTSDLYGRIVEHRDELLPGFTKQHGVKMLVYFEERDDVDVAIQREKRIKRWRRSWKIELIERTNPDWRDLWIDLTT